MSEIEDWHLPSGRPLRYATLPAAAQAGLPLVALSHFLSLSTYTIRQSSSVSVYALSGDRPLCGPDWHNA